jgi:hypothetical protein
MEILFWSIANSTSTQLTFMDLTGFDSNAGWIDNVSLVPAPEPTTYIAGALLLLPLAANSIRSLWIKRPA